MKITKEMIDAGVQALSHRGVIDGSASPERAVEDVFRAMMTAALVLDGQYVSVGRGPGVVGITSPTICERPFETHWSSAPRWS